MSACRSCGAEILWCATEKGKRMPLDAIPKRLFVLEHGLDGDTPTGFSRNAYTSHFVTCPNADEHRTEA